jgi:hypothetical protein
MSNTLRELLASQDELVREAALALPHSFSQCTHSLGYIRQAVPPLSDMRYTTRDLLSRAQSRVTRTTNR